MLTFRNVSIGNSFFSFIYEFWYARQKSNNRAFHRLCSLMRKMEAKTAIVENIEPNDGLIRVPLLNNYIYSTKMFDCQIKCSDKDIYTYKIFGSYFCQQNSFTSVCGHAALCMTINNTDLSKIGIITAERLNKFLRIDHKSKRIRENINILDTDIMSFLESMGLSVVGMNFFENLCEKPVID